MKHFALTLTALVSSLVGATPLPDLLKGSPEEQGRAVVLELAARNAGYQDLAAQVDMVLTDADGSESKRGFTLKLLEHTTPAEGDRSLIVFDTPADVRGTSVLSHSGGETGDDEQWLYLPSARRTKRIASSNRSGTFVGSEFTFEDLTGNDVRKHSWKLLGKKACGEGSCFELEAVPKDSSSAYSRRVLLLDGDDLRIRSIDFFDRKGTALKTLTYDDFTKLNGKYLRAQKWVMHNTQTGKTTSIRFTAMKVATGLTVADFSPGMLSR